MEKMIQYKLPLMLSGLLVIGLGLAVRNNYYIFAGVLMASFAGFLYSDFD